MNIKGALALLTSNARYKIQSQNLHLKGISFVEESEIPSVLGGLKSLENANIAVINNVATQIIYNGLLVELKIKKDYPKEFYSLVEDVLHVDEGALQPKVLKHLCASFIQSFKELDLAIVEESAEMRFILKSLEPKFKIILKSKMDSILDSFNSLLEGKRVMVLSPRSDLIKVQFVRLKTDLKTKGKFDFNLCALNPEVIIESADRSLYFESLDALKMAILTYDFDTLIIQDSIYALPLIQFANGLNKSAISLGEEIYKIFNIAMNSSDITESDSLTISLESFDKEIIKNKDAKFTTGSSRRRGK